MLEATTYTIEDMWATAIGEGWCGVAVMLEIFSLENYIFCVATKIFLQQKKRITVAFSLSDFVQVTYYSNSEGLCIHQIMAFFSCISWCRQLNFSEGPRAKNDHSCLVNCSVVVIALCCLSEQINFIFVIS